MKVYVVPTISGWEAIKEGHRRGLRKYGRKSDVSRVARGMVREAGGGQVLWLNAAHKVERVDRMDGTW